MNFTIRRMHIPPKPEHWYKGAVAKIFSLILLPIILIALLVVVLYALGYWLLDLLRRKPGSKNLQSNTQQPALPKKVFQNERLRLASTAIDWDTDIEQAFGEWIEELGWRNEYEELNLKRLLTQPEVTGLHQQLIGPFCQERNGGLFLQLFEPVTTSDEPAGTSWLVYLNYTTLTWERVEEVGPGYLEVSPNDLDLLLADFNDGSQLWLRVDAQIQPPVA